MATFDTLVGMPDAVIQVADTEIAQLGMKIHSRSAPEGYLQTRWFDVTTRRSHRANTNPERLVRLRVWTDLVTPRETQVVIETVYRRTIDPSVPDREVELVADPGTSADSLTRAVLAALRTHFGKVQPPKK